MRMPIINILCLLTLFLFPSLCHSDECKAQHPDWRFNQIEQTDSGLLKSTGSDPYIIFPLLENTLYDVSGVQLEIAFTPLPDKPVLMELFWRPDFEGFSEFRKVFFVLLPPKTGNTLKFFIPLKNQTGYKRFRLDFPRDLATSFLVKDFAIIPSGQALKNVEVVEAFQRLTVTETRKPEVLIPYLLQTFKHGITRLSKDPGFLVFWFLLMGLILVGTRIVSRSNRDDDK